MNLEKFYDRVYDWVILYGPRFVLGIAALFIGLWVVKLLTRWIHSTMHHREVDPTAKPFILSLISVALRILVILAVMQIMGIEMTLFTALVGAFGVAAGLALSGTLQNFASGIIILLVKPFVVGDNIITQGLEGTVTSIQIFYTFVTTFDNRSVIVPNSKLSNEVIINISREGNRRLDIEIKFKFDIDFEKVKQTLNAAVDQCDHVLIKPERRIGIGGFDFDGYKVSLNVWIESHGFQDTKLKLQEAILKAFNQAGIYALPKEVA